MSIVTNTVVCYRCDQRPCICDGYRAYNAAPPKLPVKEPETEEGDP